VESAPDSDHSNRSQTRNEGTGGGRHGARRMKKNRAYSDDLYLYFFKTRTWATLVTRGVKPKVVRTLKLDICWVERS